MGVTFEGKIYNDQQSFELPNDKSGTIALTSDVGASYLVYTALLSQTGTAAPVATVLENTLGGAVVWTRNAAGDYRGTLAGIFITDKVFFVIHCGESTDLFVTAGIVSVNEIYLNSYSSGFFDSLLINTSVEIRVYP